MFGTQNYLPVAQANEAVFRNILRDLKLNRAKRSGGIYISDDLDPEAPLEAIYEKFSTGDRHGVFTLTSFSVEGDRATIAFEDVATLSGGGAGLEYKISGTEVEYKGPQFVMMS